MGRKRPNTGRKSDHYDHVPGKTCGACGGSGSQVDASGKHVDACRTCRGFGKV